MRCDDIFSSLSCEAKILNKKNFSRQFLHTFVRTCRITYTLTKTYIHSGTKHIHIQRCTGALAVVMLCWCVCGWVYAFKKERRISLWWCFLLAIMSSCLPLKCSHTLLSFFLSFSLSLSLSPTLISNPRRHCCSSKQQHGHPYWRVTLRALGSRSF